MQKQLHMIFNQKLQFMNKFIQEARNEIRIKGGDLGSSQVSKANINKKKQRSLN
jgi:hypothetical protein